MLLVTSTPRRRNLWQGTTRMPQSVFKKKVQTGCLDGTDKTHLSVAPVF